MTLMKSNHVFCSQQQLNLHWKVGKIYEGILDYETNITDLKEIPETKTKVMLNLADPDSALRWWRLPIDGIGLAR